jgi:hypothetical protein
LVGWGGRWILGVAIRIPYTMRVGGVKGDFGKCLVLVGCVKRSLT